MGDLRKPAMRSAAVTVVALGPQHPRLGELTTFSLDHGLGGTISAGARAKDPPSHEPNEDGFLLRRDEGRVAVLVVDGAGGFAAAAAVMDAVDRVLLGAGRCAPLHKTAAAVWASALAARGRAQVHDTSAPGRPHVAASLALVDADGTTWCATAGDTALIAVSDGDVRLLSGVAPHLNHRAQLPQPQRLRLTPGTALVGVSDGFFDALGSRWPAVVRDVSASTPRGGASGVAEHLVGAALDAGGADHVTVVVHRRPPAP